METFSHFEIFNYAGRRVVEGHKVTNSRVYHHIVNDNIHPDAGLLLPRGQPVPGHRPPLRLCQLWRPGQSKDGKNKYKDSTG